MQNKRLANENPDGKVRIFLLEAFIHQR